MALKVCLVSSDGTISARRIKADDCFLSAKGIEMLSSLEVAKLRCEAGQLGLIVKKRLGVGNFAEMISEGPIKLGSLFSNMSSLPERVQVSNKSMETFSAAISTALTAKSN